MRPAAKELVIEEVSEELEAILRAWERKSALVKSLHGRHTRVVYNTVFEVEKLAEGKFYLETPDKGRIDLKGIEPGKGEKSQRLGKSGQPYRLESDRPERWICTGKEIVIVNDEEKSYETFPIPSQMQGENIVNSPLPFLFGMKAEEAKRRYRLTLKSNNEKTAMIITEPRFESDAQNYTQAWIILDKARYLPTAVKLFDTTGNLETVYKFEILDVNDQSVLRKLKGIFGDEDPFRPELRKQGYKLVLPPQAEIAAPRQPAAGVSRPGSSNGSRPNGTGVQPVNGQQAPRYVNKSGTTSSK